MIKQFMLKHEGSLLLLFAVAIITVPLFFDNAPFSGTGAASAEVQSDSYDIKITQSSEFMLSGPENFASLRISGHVQGGGEASVYLIDGYGDEYLVYSSEMNAPTTFNLLTGNAVGGGKPDTVPKGNPRGTITQSGTTVPRVHSPGANAKPRNRGTASGNKVHSPDGERRIQNSQKGGQEIVSQHIPGSKEPQVKSLNKSLMQILSAHYNYVSEKSLMYKIIQMQINCIS